ncbi:hypothetical protein U91I_01777 [alpha proteobacterium U9-1i]|nr:hypothetical protein U91I_01777 [alpha proteobacterium U9-1i]
MADVLIVCVREDEPQAKALADMFEAAGFSIGGAPSSDGALRSSGAGVIVWSRSSIRSRPFLDAAQRVVNAGKGVVASLIEPPPPSSVGDAPTFDLSAWSGDAEDPSLDPLFFAVDRMVNSARAAVGVGQAEPAPQAFEPPPSLRPPPAAPPPRPASRAAPQPPPAMPNLFSNRARSEGLNSEAEHWRAIRDSKNPADFMDYIARYGADGAFAEVAELRLKQLTSQGGAPAAPTRAGPLRDAARAAAAEPLRPTRAYEPPPPPRRPDPPPQQQRRVEPTPLRRPDPPPRREAPNYDRYDRPPAETREPPKAGGGAMRGLIILLLLAGGAVGAGMYFGSDQQAAQNEDIAPAAISAPADAPADSGATPDGVGLSDLAEQAPARNTPQREAAARNERAAAAQRERQERTRQEPEAEAATPAPVTSWNQASGPVSLQAGAPNSGPAVTVPLTPPINAEPAPTQVADNRPAAATPTAAPTISWSQRPSANRIAELYPARALREGVGGRVVLDCVVQPALTVACSVASETPASAGFGRAALSASSSYRAVSARSDGSTAVGARARLAITFRPPQ